MIEYMYLLILIFLFVFFDHVSDLLFAAFLIIPVTLDRLFVNIFLPVRSQKRNLCGRRRGLLLIFKKNFIDRSNCDRPAFQAPHRHDADIPDDHKEDRVKNKNDKNKVPWKFRQNDNQSKQQDQYGKSDGHHQKVFFACPAEDRFSIFVTHYFIAQNPACK